MENLKISKAYKDLYIGMINKDRKLLNQILDDDFTLTHMTGMVQNKEDFIESILNGVLNYYDVDHKEIIYNEPVFTGRSKVLAKVFGGSKNSWNLELKGEIEKKEDLYKFKNLKAATFK